MSADRIAAEFEKAYGVSLDEMWQEVTDAAGRDISCVLLWECSGPALEPGTKTVVGQECDGTNQFRTLTVEEESNLLFRQDLPWLNQLSSCTPVPQQVSLLASATSSVPEVTLVHLEPGDYSFGTSAYFWDTQIEVTARLTTDGGLTSRCDEAAPLAFTSEELGDYAPIKLTLPPGAAGDIWYLRLFPGDDHRFAIRAGSSTLETSLCLGCTDDCVSLSERSSPPLDGQGVATLRIERVEPYEYASQISLDWTPNR